MIQYYQYDIAISGDFFQPDRVEESLGVKFRRKRNRGDVIAKGSGGVSDEGYGVLSPEQSFAFRPLGSDDELLELLETYESILRDLGATSIVVYCGVYYSGECDLVFAAEQLRRVCDIGAILAISCYEVNDV